MNPGAKVEIATNAPEFKDALMEWMGTFHIGARQAIRYQGRLMGERLIQLTPPRSLKQGKERVTKDIRKVILGLRDAMDDPGEKVEKGQDFVKAFIDSKGVVYAVAPENYQPHADADTLDKWHQSKRAKRGRVPGRDTPKAMAMGKWNLLNVLVAPASIVDAYIKSVQKRVGRGRAGWAFGTLVLGGKAAKWVSQHAGKTGGFTDGTRSGWNVFVEFDNHSEWAAGGDDDRIMENAMKSRVNSIRKSILDTAKGAGKALQA